MARKLKKKCRHKKLLAYAYGVEFLPDEEPFTSGVVEDSGITAILVDMTMYYCTKCKKVLDVSVDSEPVVENS